MAEMDETGTVRVKDSSFYNQIYRSYLDKYSLDRLEESAYFSLWKKAVDMIGEKDVVLELGCGPGLFAYLALEHGIDYRLGLDFSQEAIDQARKNNPDYGDHFKVRDITKTTPKAYRKMDVVVCLEVLEHIEDDIDVVKTIPGGMKVIFSVPDYDSESHVRRFKRFKKVRRRYGDLIKIESREKARPQEFQKNIWLFKGRRRK